MVPITGLDRPLDVSQTQVYSHDEELNGPGLGVRSLVRAQPYAYAGVAYCIFYSAAILLGGTTFLGSTIFLFYGASPPIML